MMGTIGYGYGSEWHLLRYLGYHRDALKDYVLKAIDGSTKDWTVDWLDVPFALNGKYLGDDREWAGVKFISEAQVKAQWRNHWPSSGSAPSWDAVGQLYKAENDSPEWLLLEAKAHVGEMESQCKAGPESAKKIHAALETTAKKVTYGGAWIPAWENDFYQLANRLAVLDFLNNICSPPIPARLLLLCFYGEREEKMPGCACPSRPVEWLRHILEVYKQLDIDPQSPLMQRVHLLFIPINPYVSNNRSKGDSQSEGEEEPLREFHQGEVIERKPEALFLVRLEDERLFSCHISGPWDRRCGLPTVGDRVWIELSPYDDDRGRIVSEYRVDRFSKLRQRRLDQHPEKSS
jgi:translation initiation factor IF-1